MIKVSVIVPVYNVEKYLAKCLDSLVNQTLKDIEIIVVNDESPDNSQDIIDEYVKKYRNIKSYKKKNGGLSDARNYGLRYATGEYIAFVDSDDYIDKTMLEKMYNKAHSNSFDLVVCDLSYVNIYNTLIKVVSSKINNDLINVDLKKVMLDFYPAACNKIFKRTLFDNNVYFKKGVLFEDVEFMHRLFPYISSIGTVKEGLYYYLQREGTITKTIDKRIYNHIDNWNGIIDFYKERNLYDDYYKEIEYCYVRYLFATFVKHATNYTNKSDYDKAVECAIDNVKSHFPNYKLNKYFYSSLKGLYLISFNKFIANIYYRIKKLNCLKN